MTAHPDGRGAVRIVRDPHGRLALHRADGSVAADVVAVRAFPLSAPDTGIALVARDGHECHWFDSLAELDAGSREAILDALAQREIVPRIRRILSVSSFVTPSEWRLETDRGDATLTLRAEEDIRRLPGRALLIADRHGIQFRVDDLDGLDPSSRRLLDRFL
jgi:hypothetical protein